MPLDTDVIVFVNGNIGINFSSEVKGALEMIGMDSSIIIGPNEPFAMIGRKGANSAQVI